MSCAFPLDKKSAYFKDDNAAQMYSSNRDLKSSSLPLYLLCVSHKLRANRSLSHLCVLEIDSRQLSRRFCLCLETHQSIVARHVSALNTNTHSSPSILDSLHHIIHPLAIRRRQRHHPLELGIRKLETGMLNLPLISPNHTSPTSHGTHIDQEIILAVLLLRDNLVGRPRQPRARSQQVDLL
jgi:hypothetical protein